MQYHQSHSKCAIHHWEQFSWCNLRALIWSVGVYTAVKRVQGNWVVSGVQEFWASTGAVLIKPKGHLF